MNKTILAFGLLIAALLILFQLGQYKFLEGDMKMEIIVAVMAIVFFFLGIYFRGRWQKQPDEFQTNDIDHNKIKDLGISQRELDVLQELANGLSNKEIAEKLFVSESTVKTHVSNLYSKLGVKKRPQAINLSKELKLVK